MELKNKNQLYAICKHKETEEYHVFVTHYKMEDQKCYFSSKECICGSMHTSDMEKCILSCAPLEKIRDKAAAVGNTICGNCMKSIYKTED